MGTQTGGRRIVDRDGQRRERCIRPVSDGTPCGAELVVMAGQGEIRAQAWAAHDAAVHSGAARPPMPELAARPGGRARIRRVRTEVAR